MTVIYLILAVLLILFAVVMYATYRLAYLYPRISIAFAILSISLASFIWYLIFTEKVDGAGGAFGIGISAIVSVFPIAAGVALLAGSLIRLFKLSV